MAKAKKKSTKKVAKKATKKVTTKATVKEAAKTSKKAAAKKTKINAKKKTAKASTAAKKKTKKMAKKSTTKKTTKSSAKKTATKKSVTKKVTAKKSKAGAASTKKKADKKVSVASKTTLNVGDKVPAFVAQATKGTVSLEALKGKKIVLYFYPKDHTSGCTIEGHDFSKALPEFEKLGAVVYGVSRDSIQSHESFIEKQSYTVDLISDPDETLCHLFGVMKEKSLYGRKYIGVDRSTFVIDEKGVITHVWRNVKVPGHVDEVLKVLGA